MKTYDETVEDKLAIKEMFPNPTPIPGKNRTAVYKTSFARQVSGGGKLQGNFRLRNNHRQYITNIDGFPNPNFFKV